MDKTEWEAQMLAIDAAVMARLQASRNAPAWAIEEADAIFLATGESVPAWQIAEGAKQNAETGR